MKLDRRYKKIIATLIILAAMTLIHLISQVLGSEALFGIKDDPSLHKFLAFDSSQPLKFGGITLFSSYFVHYNWPHLIQDLVLLGFFSMMLEARLGALKTMSLPLIVHALALAPMALVLPKQHIFLGSSLGGICLFTYYCLTNKKPILLSIGLIAILGLGFYQTNDLYSNFAHFLAVVFSFLLFFIPKHFLARSKKS